MIDAVVNKERFVGQPLARIEDPALLTGRGRFLDDLDPLPGTLVAAIVRSPHAHARIRGVDLERARAHPGVAAVIGPEEVLTALRPFPLSLRAPMPYYPTGTDKVRFVGEPVAVVVATDRYTAEDAAELVHVDYELLPAVVDTKLAMKPDAPRLHDTANSNIASDRVFNFGEVDAALERAAHVVTEEYSFPRYSSTPMECFSVIAEWRDEADGPRVTAYANFHGPFSMVPVLTGALGISPAQLRLIVPQDIGGSFGIKAGIYPYIALLAVASRHAGRPVRWTEDRIEHLLASSAGSDRIMRFTAAVDAQGCVQALDVDFMENVGAYLRPPEPATLYRCFGNITGAYRIDTVRLRSRAVVTNKAPTGLNRGFGGQQLYFGLERLMDKVAHTVGLDPLELRRRNLIPSGSFPYATPTGGIYDSGDYEKALAMLVESSGYRALRAEQAAARGRGELVGSGIAVIVEPSATNIGYVGLATPQEERKIGREKSGSTEHVRVTVDPYGVVSVLLGTVPQGQGHATVARQVVADQLGLPLEMVVPKVDMDTSTTPWTVTSGSYSSRFSPLLTSAIVEATERIAQTIKVAAAVLLSADPAELELAGGNVRVATAPERSVKFRHAAGLVHWDPGSLPDGVNAALYAEAAFTPPEATAPSRTDQVNSSLCYGFVAELVQVRIDPETYEICIEKVNAIHDAGTVLNPLLIEGQVHGAMTHGLGGALYEEMAYTDAGQPTSTFMDYLVPTSAETGFPLVAERLVTPSPVTRLGAKGSGEGSSMSFPVAIANAVADALSGYGVEITSLPLHGNVIDALLSTRADNKRNEQPCP
ncbi:carbon monoxide dehydrogenase [Intrasporangium chromatireducens Q5-1]|uniref:Carbon monoxide dehydrogenase n=1 Tax=Intrasporangium chromatireducens Q5-1 TaxID=584657 RepID=W9GM21_9MICO|nr:xanthine dehydrogenase family protein molybdopterin-binding subunit [Intrasporangium chromatireducens]EWT06147.1 carbon monoxide dehydrogenase [Intrasporangium chromatireducens Q5-1]